MIRETALPESRSLRDGVVERTIAPARVKVLSLLPDGMHVTTAMVATYFQVGIKAIESLVVDHRQELESNSYQVLTGAELTSFQGGQWNSITLAGPRALLPAHRPQRRHAAPGQRSRTSGAYVPARHGVHHPHGACG
jgi:hypothetical protein